MVLMQKSVACFMVTLSYHFLAKQCLDAFLDVSHL